MSSTCCHFALHDPGGLQKIGEGTFAGTRGNDKVAPLPAIRGLPGGAAPPRPGGRIPKNKIVVKEKSKIHLPVLGLVPLGSRSGSRGAR
jgi:hypothetical protein